MVRRALLLLALAGCLHQDHDDRICEDSFLTVTVAVHDANGAPIEGLAHHTVRVADNVDITPSGFGFPDFKTYAVLDDTNLDDLDPDGSELAITIGGASFSAVGIGGGCHVVYDGPHELALP